jgi:hypothetical protein
VRSRSNQPGVGPVGPVADVRVVRRFDEQREGLHAFDGHGDGSGRIGARDRSAVEDRFAVTAHDEADFAVRADDIVDPDGRGEGLEPAGQRIGHLGPGMHPQAVVIGFS